MHRSLLAPGVLLLSAVFVSLSAQAALGPFEHGSGIKAMGAGGVSYVGVDETTALSANPALAATMGSRWDLGVDVLHLKPYARIEGNALADDQTSRSNGRSWYSIPQAGWVRPLSDRWSLGVTMLQAGLGPDYPDSQYQRFGGDKRAALTLGSASLATALAWRPVDRQAFGAGLIVGYEFLRVQGLQFLASKDPQFQVSTDPDHVTNQGKDGGFSVGYTLGWTGELLPTLTAGAGYRSKSWTQKIDDYRGLLPDHGSLELPAVYGLALGWQAQPALNVAVEWQHYAYTAEKAFGNTISRLSRGNLLGSPDGPGFGVDNQDAYKLGLSWKARSNLVLRAGYLHATQMVRRSDTLFTALAPVAMTTHYTTGLTYTTQQKWEFTTAFTYCPRRTIEGRNSIPPNFGGGEATVSNVMFSTGFTVGRRF